MSEDRGALSVFHAVIFFFCLFANSITAGAQDADPAALKLIESLSLRESAKPIRQHPRWAEPRKVAAWYRPGLGISREEFQASMVSVAGDPPVSG